MGMPLNMNDHVFGNNDLKIHQIQASLMTKCGRKYVYMAKVDIPTKSLYVFDNNMISLSIHSALYIPTIHPCLTWPNTFDNLSEIAVCRTLYYKPDCVLLLCNSF